MKIGIDARSLMDRQYSGVSRYAYELIREILKQDGANKYLLFYNSGSNIADRMPKFDNVRLTSTRYPNKLFNYFFQKLCQYPKIDKILGGVDIFFSPHINFTSLSSKAKEVLTVHDVSFLKYPEFFSIRKNIWHWALDFKKRLLRADKIVAVSDNTKDDLVKILNINPEKILVIHSGISDNFRKLDQEDEALKRIRDKYNLPAKFILFLGTLEPRKNIAGLIRALDQASQSRELDDFELIIAGGSGWKKKEILQTAKNIKAQDKVRFIGYVPEEDKVYLYNLASIFAYPSFYEGFGFPPLEAMASGTPVLSSANSSLLETLGEAALLVDPSNISDIAQGLKCLARDERLRNRLIDKGFVQAGKFNWQKSASQTIELFNNYDK